MPQIVHAQYFFPKEIALSVEHIRSLFVEIATDGAAVKYTENPLDRCKIAIRHQLAKHVVLMLREFQLCKISIPEEFLEGRGYVSY